MTERGAPLRRKLRLLRAKCSVLLDHERERRFLRFAPLQGALGDSLRRDTHFADIDSVIWYESDGNAFVRSAAALRVLRYLGGGWAVLATVGAIVPRPVRDWMYDIVARHRRRLIRPSPSCLMPTAEQRGRFLRDGDGSAPQADAHVRQ